MSLLIVVRAGGIEYEGINVWHKDGSEVKSYIVKRNIPNSCTKMLITNDFGLKGIDFRMDVVTNLKLIDKIKNQINN